MEYLFTYGTLLSGFKHEVLNSISKYLTLIGPAAVNGALYDLGNYPGLVEGRNGEVKGELYSITEKELVFKVLDEYEGLNEYNPEYKRVKKIIMLPGRRKIEGWVYIYIKRITAEDQHIKDGDYLSFRRTKI
jgi:gamma-glutamylcyclotransferase (GGCT)/AIG2-like uncharacterized protein YtfP